MFLFVGVCWLWVSSPVCGNAWACACVWGCAEVESWADGISRFEGPLKGRVFPSVRGEGNGEGVSMSNSLLKRYRNLNQK